MIVVVLELAVVLARTLECELILHPTAVEFLAVRDSALLQHASEGEGGGLRIRNCFPGEKYQLSFSASGIGIGKDLRRFGRVCVKRAGESEDRCLMVCRYLRGAKYKLRFQPAALTSAEACEDSTCAGAGKGRCVKIRSCFESEKYALSSSASGGEDLERFCVKRSRADEFGVFMIRSCCC